MNKLTLRGTTLEVSRLCFGAMTFGKPVDQATANKMVHHCLDKGINFIDTANIYQAGLSESMLGEAMRGKRDQLIVATKGRGKMGNGPDESGLSKRALFRAVEDSLKRLQTDYVDLYYLHQPDYDVPIEETLGALDELVKQGKIRFPGTSNYSGWQVCEMLWMAKANKYKPAYVSQPMYNLLARGIEQEYLPMAKHYDVAVIAYNPLAGGLLTGKHRQAAIPPGTRFDNNSMYQERYWNERTFETVGALRKLADQAGTSLVTLSVAWVLASKAVTAPIIGASRPEQLDASLAAAEYKLDPDLKRQMDELTYEYRLGDAAR